MQQSTRHVLELVIPAQAGSVIFLRELTHLYFSTFCSATTLFKVLYFTKKITFW